MGSHRLRPLSRTKGCFSAAKEARDPAMRPRIDGPWTERHEVNAGKADEVFEEQWAWVDSNYRPHAYQI